MKRIIGILGVILLGGCTTMEVKNTDGVKSMLTARVMSVAIKKRVMDAKPKNQEDVMLLYEEARNINNAWIDGIKFDLQAKSLFDVDQKAYADHPAGVSAAKFLTSAAASLVPKPPAPAPAKPGQQDQPAPSPSKDKSALPSPSESEETVLRPPNAAGPGEEAGDFVNQIINNIIATNKANAEEARKRIYTELDKSKWVD